MKKFKVTWYKAGYGFNGLSMNSDSEIVNESRLQSKLETLELLGFGYQVEEVKQ